MNEKEMTQNLPTWEKLAKLMIWQQLGAIENKTVLDFGSGQGITANYFAQNNRVIAIEPSEEMLQNAVNEYAYQQIQGSLEALKSLPSESVDCILCHNVLEYADKREEIVSEFCRILKTGGTLSVVKHNRYGRVMQMAVLLNNFDEVNNLLEGKNSTAAQFGAIRYYEDEDILKWGIGLQLQQTYGIRTFWDLQQNQEIQQNSAWQEKMLAAEIRVSTIKEFADIAFFHHLLYTKQKSNVV